MQHQTAGGQVVDNRLNNFPFDIEVVKEILKKRTALSRGEAKLVKEFINDYEKTNKAFVPEINFLYARAYLKYYLWSKNINFAVKFLGLFNDYHAVGSRFKKNVSYRAYPEQFARTSNANEIKKQALVSDYLKFFALFISHSSLFDQKKVPDFLSSFQKVVDFLWSSVVTEVENIRSSLIKEYKLLDRKPIEEDFADSETQGDSKASNQSVNSTVFDPKKPLDMDELLKTVLLYIKYHIALDDALKMPILKCWVNTPDDFKTSSSDIKCIEHILDVNSIVYSNNEFLFPKYLELIFYKARACLKLYKLSNNTVYLHKFLELCKLFGQMDEKEKEKQNINGLLLTFVELVKTSQHLSPNPAMMDVVDFLIEAKNYKDAYYLANIYNMDEKILNMCKDKDIINHLSKNEVWDLVNAIRRFSRSATVPMIGTHKSVIKILNSFIPKELASPDFDFSSVEYKDTHVVAAVAASFALAEMHADCWDSLDEGIKNALKYQKIGISLYDKCKFDFPDKIENLNSAITQSLDRVEQYRKMSCFDSHDKQVVARRHKDLQVNSNKNDYFSIYTLSQELGKKTTNSIEVDSLNIWFLFLTQKDYNKQNFVDKMRRLVCNNNDILYILPKPQNPDYCFFAIYIYFVDINNDKKSWDRFCKGIESATGKIIKTDDLEKMAKADSHPIAVYFLATMYQNTKSYLFTHYRRPISLLLKFLSVTNTENTDAFIGLCKMRAKGYLTSEQVNESEYKLLAKNGLKIIDNHKSIDAELTGSDRDNYYKGINQTYTGEKVPKPPAESKMRNVEAPSGTAGSTVVAAVEARSQEMKNENVNSDEAILKKLQEINEANQNNPRYIHSSAIKEKTVTQVADIQIKAKSDIDDIDDDLDGDEFNEFFLTQQQQKRR